MFINFDMESMEKKYKVKFSQKLVGVSNFNNLRNNTLVFCLEYNEKYLELFIKVNNCLILVNEEAKIPEIIKNNNIILYIDNPRREYVWILNNYTIKERKKYSNSSYYISENATIGDNLLIEPFVFLDNNVKIGNNCILKSGVKIYENTIIGDSCVIGPNTVIGERGFGTERINKGKRKTISFEGIPMKMPHYGGVIIGNNVEIGSLNTIASGAIEPTRIGDNTKTDDHVHIAHNCIIEEGVLIAACSEISGSVEIGKNSWIGPNTSMMQKIKIGEKSIVGLGAVVLKSMENGAIIVGNPGKDISKIKK